MTDPLATPSDVDPAIIATDLDDSEIQPHIDYAARKIARHVDVDTLDGGHRTDLEAHYAALRIRTVSNDRAISQGSGESTSVTFEGSSLETLREEIDDLDPSGELVDTGPDFHFEAF